MLTMFVCATCWLSMHLYSLPHMSMHESCLLVCRPCFNTMKLWTFDPNLCLSPTNTTFCLLSFLFAFLLVCSLASLSVCLLVHLLILLLVMSPATCYTYFTCLLVCFIPIAHYLRISFFPLHVCWFFVFAFACTHMERECMELGHGLPSTSKKGADASM